MDANEWRWPDTFFREHLPGLVDKGYLTRGVLDAFFVDWDERSLEPDAVFFGSPRSGRSASPGYMKKPHIIS
jgi:hypothetical protein